MNKREFLVGSLAALGTSVAGYAQEPTPDERRVVRFAGRVTGKRIESEPHPRHVIEAEICGLYYSLGVTPHIYTKYRRGQEITAECIMDEHGRYTICRLADTENVNKSARELGGVFSVGATVEDATIDWVAVPGPHLPEREWKVFVRLDKSRFSNGRTLYRVDVDPAQYESLQKKRRVTAYYRMYRDDDGNQHVTVLSLR